MTPLIYQDYMKPPRGGTQRTETEAAICPNTNSAVLVPVSRAGQWWACPSCGSVHRVAMDNGKVVLKCL